MNTLFFSLVLCVALMFHEVSPGGATVIMSVPVNAESGPATLIATRSTRDVDHVRVLPANDENRTVAIYRTTEDMVEVSLDRPGSESVILWTKTKQADRSLDMEHLMERLVLFDVLYDASVVWVLYSQDSRVFLDRVTTIEEDNYRVDGTYAVATLVMSSLQPYVIEMGTILRHEDTIVIAAYLDSYRAYDRQHPYVFWRLEDGSPVEIHDPETITLLRDEIGGRLEADRPRMSAQMKPPWAPDRE